MGFNSNVKFDLDRFICGGHSFGGMTAIEVAKQEPERVKAVYTFDPWIYAVNDNIETEGYGIEQPQVHVLSDGFAPVIQEYFDYDTEEML